MARLTEPKQGQPRKSKWLGLQRHNEVNKGNPNGSAYRGLIMSTKQCNYTFNHFHLARLQVDEEHVILVLRAGIEVVAATTLGREEGHIAHMDVSVLIKQVLQFAWN